MPTVADYLREQEKARGKMEFANHRIRQAYDAGLDTLVAEGSVNFERLDTEEARTAFTSTTVDKLVEPLRAAISAMAGGYDACNEALILNGFYGFTREHVATYVNGTKSKGGFESFMQYIDESTGYKSAMEIRARAPLGVLNEIPAADVLRYAGLEAHMGRMDLSKFGLKEKAELVGEFKRNGAVTPNFLRDKPYISALDIPRIEVAPPRM